MAKDVIKIGVVAPASCIDLTIANRVIALAHQLYPDNPPEIIFHPQCFMSYCHFAGDDTVRARSFLEVANDETFDVLWFACGGYGSCRLVKQILPSLTNVAHNKIYLGYSDTGSLLAGLYKYGCFGTTHGPMPTDIKRINGEIAIARVFDFLIKGDLNTLESTVLSDIPTVAFNSTILSNLIGTPFEPDLTDHILMLEEVSEHLYRIDRTLFHLTNTTSIRRVAGIKLGRCSNIPQNEPKFGKTVEEIIRYWCDNSGIAYLGSADIGHDVNNKIVPFGCWKSFKSKYIKG
ncbi:MAG: LD-carboxypeptidase [Rhodospirillaceae bacterium]|jgi:muramoyltetrapeptide carboxypeptidase|nr:LD-carboxypeptidase [Rhodospirillaceae bacterium]